MLLEMVVVSSCLYVNCESAVQSYYIFNPSFRDRTEEIVNTAGNVVSTDVKNYVLPVAGFIVNKRYSIKFKEKTSVFVDLKSPTTLGISLDF